jgi:hypothetical protein
MTTQVSKIKIRQGNFADLPLLDAGEFGYATDTHRLFLGNNTVTVGTGNGVNDTFTVPITLADPTTIIAVFVDDVQENASNYSLVGTSLTFSTPPANAAVVTAKYNSEVHLHRYATNPHSIELPANGNAAAVGFNVDTTLYDTVIMDYTLKSSNGIRVGQLRFSTDTTSSTTAIDDNYTETGTVDVIFTADISISNTLRLMYTDNDNAISKFKYTYQLWNSN